MLSTLLVFLGLGLCPAQAGTWPVLDAPPASWASRPGGLSVADVKVGAGEAVVEGARVEVHYVGMLPDGTVFDASRPRGEAFTFRVGDHKVIRGWEQGLVGMQVGGIRRLEIPPGLGYGDRAAGPIPPNSRLFFEVELLGVRGPRKVPTAPTAVDEGGFRGAAGGLRWADLSKGEGNPPKKGHRVCVDFVTWANGEVVDHSLGRESCWWIRYGESDVPTALMDGLKGMREGGRRQLLVPAGRPWKTASSEAIPPGTRLVVELELVEATR